MELRGRGILFNDQPSVHINDLRRLQAMRIIPERDWKRLRSIKDRALNDACARIFEAVEKIAKKRDGREHEAYLELWKLLRKQDDVIALMFNDFKRSTALLTLAVWWQQGLVSESELALFTEETRARVNIINENLR